MRDKAFIDTNIFLYAFSDIDTKKQNIAKEILLQEVYLYRCGNHILMWYMRVYVNFFARLKPCLRGKTETIFQCGTKNINVVALKCFTTFSLNAIIDKMTTKDV